MTSKGTKRYKRFVHEGEMETLAIADLASGLIKSGRSKFGIMGRAFLIILFYSGARPIELLQLKPESFEKTGSRIKIKILAVKRGESREIFLSTNKRFVKELWTYANSLPDNIYLFYDLISSRTSTHKTKLGETIKYKHITDRVNYHVKKWMGVPPQFIRYSRLCSLFKAGASDIQIKRWMGYSDYNFMKKIREDKITLSLQDMARYIK